MKDSKNLVIGLLCTVLCIMAVAYAAFSTTLTINGTASIDSTWGVEIDDVTCTPVAGGSVAIDYTEPEVNGTSVTIDAGFNQPGDTLTCVVTIVNTGNLEARLESITPTAANVAAGNTTGTTTGRDFIHFTTEVAVENVTIAKVGDVLGTDADDKHQYTIRATYRDVKDANDQSVAFPKEDVEEVSLTVDFNYVQNITTQQGA